MASASVTRSARRASPLLVGATLAMCGILGFAATITPVRAVDPTAEPSPGTDPSPLTSPTPVDPTADPVTTPDPLATPDPTVFPDPTAPADPTAAPDPSAVPSPEPSADPSPAPAPDPLAQLRVDHLWLDAIDPRTGSVVPGAIDVAGAGIERGRLYVVRFQVVNGTDAVIDVRPVLEFGQGAAPATWLAVPATNPVDGLAFYTSANVRRGEDTRTKSIPIADLRLASSADAAGVAVAGSDNAGVNPGAIIALPAHGFTELAFTIRATASADWLTTFGVRLVDGGASIAGASAATVTTGARPTVKLSSGQRSGIDVEPKVVYRFANAGVSIASPHGPYTLTTDACAACHTTHKAAGRMLLSKPAPQSGMCFTCHDGSGAASDIAAQYADPTVPANDAGTDAYYSHPATVLSNHVGDQGSNEFGGVLNRHAACADCHQPHLADATLAVETAEGWTASGALAGASGVSVTNGAAGTQPVYSRTATSTFEYQLCFKCHSGYTTLPAQTGPPSTWALDKAVELNPANVSYHPVEAPGKNTTSEMDVSLSGDPVYGTSPYKLWNFTSGSTIRCVNCHGDSRLANPASPPAAGARLAPHAVANRGMLIAPLRDRVLKGSTAAYQASDFALCYVCHAEAPFVDTSQGPLPDTNFPLHGTHTAGIAAFTGAGGTVDDDGAGHGNAICAECHFRTHGTAFAVDGQTPASRLVNFAPNVQPYQGTNPTYAGRLEWLTPANTCTLTCHGVDHAAWGY